MIILEKSRPFYTTDIGGTLTLPYIIAYGVQESLPDSYKTKLDVISILEALSQYNGDDDSVINIDSDTPEKNKSKIKKSNSRLVDILQYMLSSDKNDDNYNTSNLKAVLEYMLKNDDNDISNIDDISKLKTVLEYMLKNDNDLLSDEDNNSKLKDVLEYMLKNDNDLLSDEDSNSKLKAVLEYMLKNDKDDISNVDNNSKLKDVLEFMLEIDKDDENNENNSDSFDSSIWKLVCFKKNSRSHNNRDRQYDLYRLANEQLMSELKSKLGIDYFALNYTVKQPTELERCLGNIRPYLADCNCQIMAFDENHKPLPQFSGQSGITNVYLEKTKDKNTFNLISGQFPAITEPTQTFTNEQFIKAITNILQKSDNNTKQLIANFPLYYNKILSIVYEDLKNIKTKSGANLADLVVTQFVEKNSTLTKVIKEVFNDLLVNTANPIITKLQNDNNSQQNNLQNVQSTTTNNQQQSATKPTITVTTK